MARWICCATVTLMLCWSQPAQALTVIERDRFYVYFTEAQAEIAERVLAACQPMAAYLEKRGLPVTTPLHIILDEALDQPQARVHMIPHREIRIPVRPPGVLEDGYLEEDPWRYFLFMGLSAQSIYSERSGIPGMVHTLFGEIISPTIILPDWCIDGIGFLLYEDYRQRPVPAPLAQSIFNAGPIPDLDLVSNHPEIWPGQFSYRIYGRPFVRWLEQRHGWEAILDFIRLHGRGIVPIEIDSKARAAFGQSWGRLWQAFQNAHDPVVHDLEGLPMAGYWDDPFVYWNDLGVHPGLRESGLRSRYGYVDADGWLRLSQYDRDGVSRLRAQSGDRVRTAPRRHVWDPGPGQVAVTRQGHRPHLVLNTPITKPRWPAKPPERDPEERLIKAPPGVIQLSGPVMDDRGRIAVAGNTGGQWDIWMHDGAWRQMTHSPSVELDPWIEDGRLVFASNITGRFQIHSLDMRQLTDAPTAAMLPRRTTCVQLGVAGWQPLPLDGDDPPLLPQSALEKPAASRRPALAPEVEDKTGEAQEAIARPYSPLKSIQTNYISPDIFYDATDLQLGLVTDGRDVTRAYAWNAGVRYSEDHALWSWRAGGMVNRWNARATFYPLGYTTSRHTTVDERRYDIRLGWSPLPTDALEVALNWRNRKPFHDEAHWEDAWWGALNYRSAFGNLHTQAVIDLFDGGSQSLYGDILYWFGERVTTVTRLRAGKTWGDLQPGHNTFRIGGNTSEGFFTQRPTRLFPLRGFDANVLDAGQAVSATMEIIWPLVELQAGYKTLPLFLRNMRLGTFVDAGFAAERASRDEWLIGAGFQLITGMEIAWGFMADFSIGLAWPLRQPDDLDHRGPVFLIQIGRPL
jgi:hypothetical protein